MQHKKVNIFHIAEHDDDDDDDDDDNDDNGVLI